MGSDLDAEDKEFAVDAAVAPSRDSPRARRSTSWRMERAVRGRPGRPVQQGGQERPIAGEEPGLDGAQLPFQHRDLVA